MYGTHCRFKKTFDRVKIKDVIHLLSGRGMRLNLKDKEIQLIYERDLQN